MAESSKADSFPEILANADNIQFAEELVGYVMLRNSSNYVSIRTPVPLREFIHAFDQIAQRAVQCIEISIEKKVNDTFSEMQSLNSVSSSAYSRFLHETVLTYLPKDFDAKIFLVFCVTMSKMAAMFYNIGILDAPDLAIMKIIDVLEKYDLREGGWDAVRGIAASLDTMLKVCESTQRRTISTEIECLNKFVSGHESINFPLSGEHNVLKENEGKIEQKQDCAFSQKNIFIKSETLEFKENKLTDKSVPKSEFSSKSDCFEKLDPTLNAKDNESSEPFSIGGNELIQSISSSDEYHMETSKACQSSNFSITKESERNLDLTSEEKSDANNPSMIWDENTSVSNSEPTEKIPDSKQMLVKYKRKLDFS